MEVKIGQVVSIQDAFLLAASAAKKATGFVAPNPLVGCVVLDKDHRLLSVGYHGRFGGPHAEVEAFKQITDRTRLKDAVVIVTLEPCAHFGKTPPCAEFLAQFPIAEVHYGLKDPNPSVRGKGLEILNHAGIKTIEAPVELKAELEILAEVFLTNQRHRECFIGLKIASSLDGMMCLENRESQWITSEAARSQGHRLRAHYGAVLTSANSLLRDHSRLNARVSPFEEKVIPVILLDESGQTSAYLKNSALAQVRSEKDIFVFTNKSHVSKYKDLPESNVLSAQTKNGLFDLREVFAKIWELGFPSLMVEAGPQLSSSVVSSGYFHRLELFIGSKILGANGTGPWTKGLKSERMSDAVSLSFPQTRTFDGDIWISGRNPKSFQALFHQD